MNTIASRLDQAMTAAGFPSQSALSRASGVPQPTINRILKSVGKGQPEAGTVQKLAEACNVSFNWLNEGIGEIGRTGSVFHDAGSGKSAKAKEALAQALAKATPSIIEIPVLKLSLTAGITGFHTELDERDFAIPVAVTQRWIEANNLVRDRLIATMVRGDSMEETLSDGDTVIINTASTTPRDNKIFAINFGGEAVVKRMIKDFGRWFLASDNPDQKRYHREECSSETCIIIGEVVMAQRNFLQR